MTISTTLIARAPIAADCLTVTDCSLTGGSGVTLTLIRSSLPARQAQQLADQVAPGAQWVTPGHVVVHDLAGADVAFVEDDGESLLIVRPGLTIQGDTPGPSTALAGSASAPAPRTSAHNLAVEAAR